MFGIYVDNTGIF